MNRPPACTYLSGCTICSVLYGRGRCLTDRSASEGGDVSDQPRKGEMFNRRKTPRFTGDLWKFPPEPLRGHRSGVHAPDGHKTPPHGRSSRHGTPCFRLFADIAGPRPSMPGSRAATWPTGTNPPRFCCSSVLIEPARLYCFVSMIDPEAATVQFNVSYFPVIIRRAWSRVRGRDSGSPTLPVLPIIYLDTVLHCIRDSVVSGYRDRGRIRGHEYDRGSAAPSEPLAGHPSATGLSPRRVSTRPVGGPSPGSPQGQPAGPLQHPREPAVSDQIPLRRGPRQRGSL